MMIQMITNGGSKVAISYLHIVSVVDMSDEGSVQENSIVLTSTGVAYHVSETFDAIMGQIPVALPVFQS